MIIAAVTRMNTRDAEPPIAVEDRETIEQVDFVLRRVRRRRHRSRPPSGRAGRWQADGLGREGTSRRAGVGSNIDVTCSG